MKKTLLFLLACLLSLPVAASAQERLTVFHAGSLSKAMADIAKRYQEKTGVTVTLVGSGSGSLRQRIEAGERPDLFASADMENPEKLAAKGLAEKPTPFTRNVLCALAKDSVGLTQANLVEKFLDPGVQLGTSTPVLDPGGDYAWMLFDLAGASTPGLADRLKAKAVKLVGDPALPMPPKDYPRNQIVWHLEQNRADVFLIYLTTAMATRQEMPGLTIVTLPPALSVGAVYGLSTIIGAPPRAADLLAFILGPEGQAILAGHGFQKP